jgi:hypothetical protein
MIFFISIYSFLLFMYSDLFRNSATSNLIFSTFSVFYYFSDFHDIFYVVVMIVYFFYDLCKLMYQSFNSLNEFSFDFSKTKHYIFHHCFGLFLCIGRCPEKYFLKQIQLCEFSSVILSLHYFMDAEINENNNNFFKFYMNESIRKMSQLFFIFTFLYFRIHLVLRNLFYLSLEHFDKSYFFELNLIPNQMYVFIQKEKYINEFRFYFIDFLTLLPFFFLHIFWVYKMILKISKIIQNKKKLFSK